MRTTAVGVCAGLIVSALAGTGFAGITVDYGSRGTALDGTPGTTVHAVSTTSGNFLDSINDTGGVETTEVDANANQDSDILALVFGGSGHAHINAHTGSPHNAQANSTYTIGITLDGTYAWVSSGTLTQLQDGGTAVSYLHFFADGGVDFLNLTTGPSNTSVDAAGSGVLGPGTYAISIGSIASNTNDGNSFATAEWNDVFISFEPVGVPEPASLGMLAVGAAGLLMRRRAARVRGGIEL